MSLLSALVGIPRRAASLVRHGPAQLAEAVAALRRLAKVSDRTAEKVDATREAVSAVDDQLGAVRSEVKALRRELNDRLLHYNFQLGRLARTAAGAGAHEGNGHEPALSGRSVPIDLTVPEHLEWGDIGEGEPQPDPDGREWIRLGECPVCGCRDFTVTSEWNKFLLLEKAPDAASARYDYAVCHACGVLFATIRPSGERLHFLLRHFGEATGKTGGGAEIKNPLLNPYPLTDAQRDDLRRMAANGVFVSDHLGLKSSDFLGGLMRDRFENVIHLDVIGALANPRGGRVVEVRSRAGTILEGLRRLFGCEVFAMPIWESQQFLLKEVYGIEASSTLIDFDHFSIPFDGSFDVIVCNHMFTHVIRPKAFFAELRRRLRPGGYIYLHNEPDDAEFLRGQQSMIATLNPLHLQAFDQRSLVRALAANGFTVTFIKARGDLKHMCLARLDESARFVPMSDAERTSRIDAYQRARDRAILGLPARLQPRVTSVWAEAVKRGVAAGVVEYDESGRLHLVAQDR